MLSEAGACPKAARQGESCPTCCHRRMKSPNMEMEATGSAIRALKMVKRQSTLHSMCRAFRDGAEGQLDDLLDEAMRSQVFECISTDGGEDGADLGIECALEEHAPEMENTKIAPETWAAARGSPEQERGRGRGHASRVFGAIRSALRVSRKKDRVKPVEHESESLDGQPRFCAVVPGGA